jgi:hypothetical protein
MESKMKPKIYFPSNKTKKFNQLIIVLHDMFFTYTNNKISKYSTYEYVSDECKMLSDAGYVTMQLEYTLDIENDLDRISKLYNYLQKRYKNLNITFLTFGSSSFLVTKLIDKNGKYKLEPKNVFMISPETNLYTRNKIFKKHIASKKLVYHHKYFTQMIKLTNKYFENNKIEKYFNYLKKFETDSKINCFFFTNDYDLGYETNSQIIDDCTINNIYEPYGYMMVFDVIQNIIDRL